MEKEASSVSDAPCHQAIIQLTGISVVRPANAQPTEIIMKKHILVTGYGEGTEDVEKIVPRIAIAFERLHGEDGLQNGQGSVPRTPKRRHDDGVSDRAAKRARGSAGRTPAPKAFSASSGADATGAENRRHKSPSLAGVVEEEEDMEMTSVVSMLTQPIQSSDRSR